MHETIQSCRFKLNKLSWKTAVLSAILSLFLLFPMGTTSAQQQPLPYDEYLAFIGRLRGDVINAQSVQGDGCNARLESLAVQLNQITQIQMPDGSIVQVDHAQAGLPFSFPYCSPVNFIRFLNGICPEDVCLTSGVVVQPDEPQLNNSSGEVTVVDLVDFTNSETLDQLPPIEPPDSITDVVEGSPVEDLGSAEELGDTAVSPETSSEGVEGEGTASDIPGGDEATGEAGTNEGIADGEGAIDSNTEGAATGETATDGGVTNDGTSDDGATGDGVNGDDTTGNEESVDSDPTAGGEENGGGATNDTTLGEEEIADPAVENQSIFPTWALILLLLLLLVIVVLIVIYIQRANRPAPLRPETEQKVEENVQTGRRLLTQGEYREAIHKLFNATLAILEDRGLIRFESFRTNYEILGAASTAPLLISHLSPVVEAYDRVWYGLEPLETAEFEALVDQIEGLRTLQRQSL